MIEISLSILAIEDEKETTVANWLGTLWNAYIATITTT